MITDILLLYSIQFLICVMERIIIKNLKVLLKTITCYKRKKVITVFNAVIKDRFDFLSK